MVVKVVMAGGAEEEHHIIQVLEEARHMSSPNPVPPAKTFEDIAARDSVWFISQSRAASQDTISISFVCRVPSANTLAREVHNALLAMRIHLAADWLYR